MPFINEMASEDARNVRSGKDGAVYNGNGKLLASVRSFTADEDVSTQAYQPVGAMQEMAVPVSYKITITIEQYVVEDDEFIQDLFNMNENGIAPEWNFQGAIQGFNGSEQRMAYPRCVPDGTINLQNITIGELLTRSWNMTCNGRPRQLGRLSK